MASKKSKPSKKEQGMDAAFAALTDIPKIDHRPEGEGWFNLDEYVAHLKVRGRNVCHDVARRQLNKLFKSDRLEKKSHGPGNLCWYRFKQD